MDDLKKQLVEQMGRLAGRLDEMDSRRERRSTNSSSSTISVNAGGLGVWLCCTACAVMLAMTIVGGLWISREFTRMDREMADTKDSVERTQTYLAAIYAHAPHLKPKESEND